MSDQTLQKMPPGNIARNPHNPRLHFEEESMAELRGSIEKVGVLVPITVYKNRHAVPKERFILLDGERRWRCAKELSLQTIPANVVDEPNDEAQNLIYMFNIHHYREDWDLFAIALKLEHLFEILKTNNEREVSAATGVSISIIRRAKNLLWYPKKYRDYFADIDGKVNPDLFIEFYPIAIWYRAQDGVDERQFESILDSLIHKFVNGVFSDVKELRVAKKCLTHAKKSQKEDDFKAVLEMFAQDPTATLEVFDVGMAGVDKVIQTFNKHISYVLDGLEGESKEYFSDPTTIAQLKALAGKINKYLENYA